MRRPFDWAKCPDFVRQFPPIVGRGRGRLMPGVLVVRITVKGLDRFRRDAERMGELLRGD